MTPKLAALLALIARRWRAERGGWPTLEMALYVAFAADLRAFGERGESISAADWIKGPDGWGSDLLVVAEVGRPLELCEAEGR